MNNFGDFLSLPDELILQICDFCDVQSLGRLASTCRKLARLINKEDFCWQDKSRRALGSNMYAVSMQRRCRPNLSFKQRLEVSRNWQNRPSSRSVILNYKRCMPWLWLDQNYLFCSKERMIVRYGRRQNGHVSFSRIKRFAPHRDDVSKFVLNTEELVTVSRDGMLGRWAKSTLRYVDVIQAHSSEVNSVAANNDVIITGSRDKTVKIWKSLPRNTEMMKLIPLEIRVLSVAIMPSNSHFIVGTPGTNNKHPLQLFDVERSEYVSNVGDLFQYGAGILDIYPEFDHTFLSCGYDTTIRLWDIREPRRDVGRWTEPLDNSVYCVKSDHHVTIISGANRNSVVHIWDKRWPGYQSLYYTIERNSPVYSVDFDAAHLYAAFDTGVVQFGYL